MRDIFDTICKSNDKIIESGETVIPTVFFIGDTITPKQLVKMTKANRPQYIQQTKDYAVKTGQSYIVVIDTIARHHGVTGDCIMRALYSPTTKILNLTWYEGHRIVKTETIEGRNHMSDEWDAWNEIELVVEQ